jgi:Family of unknown function (DUF5678)
MDHYAKEARMSQPRAGRAPLNAHALQDHRNQWVAVRNGEVVAWADDPQALTSDARMHQGDALYHVPSSSHHFHSVA